jgi:hypothetical protein
MAARTETTPLDGAARTGLGLLRWSLASWAALALLHGLYVAQSLTELRGLSRGFDVDDSEALIERLWFLWKLTGPIETGLALLGLVGLFVLGRSGVVAGARRFWVAAAFGAVGVVSHGVAVVSRFTDEPWLSASTHEIVAVAGAIGFAAAALLTVIALVGAARARGVDLPGNLLVAAVPFLIWPAVYTLILIYGERIDAQSAWVHYFLGTVLWACGVGWILYFVSRLRGRRSGAIRQDATDQLSGDWRLCADGLKLYGDALVWRLLVTVFAYMLLFVALLGRSIALAKLIGWVLPLAAVITSVAMVVGIARYARQPSHSPAGGAAWAAFGGMLIGVLLELYGLVLTLRLLMVGDGSRYRSLSDIQDLAERAQSVSTFAMAVGFFSLITLLASFAKIINYIGPTQLFGRLVGVATALVMVAFAVVATRSHTGGMMLGAGATLTAAVLVLGFALITIVAYIGLTRAIERSIRDRMTDGADLPVARVVE